MKRTIRNIILKFPLTREIFFIIGKRKVPLRKIDYRLKNIKYNDFENVERIDDLVISLTSYGERIQELKYVLYSLIMQSIRPLKIIVNVSYDDKDLITEELRFFEKFNVEFYFCDDIKSFKKLIPTLGRYNDKVIVTCDDDMFYEKEWLKQLWNKHLDTPLDIIAHNIYEISFDHKNLLPYDSWPHSIVSKKSSYKNFLVGCGGVLYPPDCFYKDIMNEKLFRELTPFADDIWFYFMAILKGTKIGQPANPQISFHYVNPYREYGITDGKTLTKLNVGQSKNDMQLLSIINFYFNSVENFQNYIEKQ